MPYAISGYAGGTLRQIVLQDDGTLTGDGLVTGWLADNPPPATDIEAVTLHVGKLLTEVHSAPLDVPRPARALPPREAAPEAGTAPTATSGSTPCSPAQQHAPYTTAELEALTVTDLRELATEAQLAGALTAAIACRWLIGENGV